MKRIGLTQRVDVAAGYAERRDGLDQRWGMLIHNLGYLPIPLPNVGHPPVAYVEALELDALILTGGNDVGDAIERDSFEAELVAVAIRTQTTLIGVCRGAQVLNLYFGGNIRRVSISNHIGTRHCLVYGDTVPDAWRDTEPVNSFHQHAMFTEDLADAFTPLAWTEDRVVEAFQHTSLPITGLMWHPERERPFVARDLAILRGLIEGRL